MPHSNKERDNVAESRPGSNTAITATYFSGRRTNRFAAILPGYDVATRRTHIITVICPGAGHYINTHFSLTFPKM